MSLSIFLSVEGSRSVQQPVGTVHGIGLLTVFVDSLPTLKTTVRSQSESAMFSFPNRNIVLYCICLQQRPLYTWGFGLFQIKEWCHCETPPPMETKTTRVNILTASEIKDHIVKIGLELGNVINFRVHWRPNYYETESLLNTSCWNWICNRNILLWEPSIYLHVCVLNSPLWNVQVISGFVILKNSFESLGVASRSSELFFLRWMKSIRPIQAPLIILYSPNV